MSPRPRRSKIWTIPVDELRNLIDKSTTMKEVIAAIGCNVSTPGGHHWRTLRLRCEEDGIDLSCLSKRRKEAQSKQLSGLNQHRKMPLSEALVENSPWRGSTSNLKKRLLSEKMIVEECSLCGLGPEWRGEKLSLALDHISGVRSDNRIENLRLLCPNCHSQTDTFCGRNIKGNGDRIYRCSVCGKHIMGKGKSGMCLVCLNHRGDWSKGRKVGSRPSVDEVSKMKETMSWGQIGTLYGVSDTTVKKWLRVEGVDPKDMKDLRKKH